MLFENNRKIETASSREVILNLLLIGLVMVLSIVGINEAVRNDEVRKAMENPSPLSVIVLIIFCVIIAYGHFKIHREGAIA